MTFVDKKSILEKLMDEFAKFESHGIFMSTEHRHYLDEALNAHAETDFGVNGNAPNVIREILLDFKPPHDILPQDVSYSIQHGEFIPEHNNEEYSLLIGDLYLTLNQMEEDTPDETGRITLRPEYERASKQLLEAMTLITGASIAFERSQEQEQSTEMPDNNSLTSWVERHGENAPNYRGFGLN